MAAYRGHGSVGGRCGEKSRSPRQVPGRLVTGTLRGMEGAELYVYQGVNGKEGGGHDR